MPLAVENFVQENTGFRTSAGTTHDVTLPSGTTAGNTLVVILATISGAPTPPANFVLAKSQSTLFAYIRSEVPASETTWQFTTAGAVYSTWYVAELSNVDLTAPVDASAVNGVGESVGNGGTASTGTSGQTAGLETVAFAAFWSAHLSGETRSWSGYTNDFEEVADTGYTGAAAPQLAVARAFKNDTTGTYETTGTFATSGSATTVMALVFALRSADSKVSAPLAGLAGFDWGTHGGMGNGGAVPSNPLGASFGAAGTWGTHYLIQAGSARTAGYGLRIATSSAVALISMPTMSATSAGSVGFDVRVVSATGTVVVAYLDAASPLELVYDASATKFGLRWNGGTAVWQSGTTALNTWAWVDIRAKCNTSVFHADWRLETAADTYTPQTSPADLTGQSPLASMLLSFGAGAAQTMTTDYDNVVQTQHYVAYPLGPHVVKLLVPETTGASVSGTSTNFSKFTANGTLAAWASDAGALLDEVPPTVSASADGVVQTAVAASDYMQFPMANYTLAANEAIAGVRALFSEWGGTGTGTGTIGYRGHDGTTETTFVAASASYDAASPTAVSSTAPLWKTAMWPQSLGWTQTKLNAAALRVGFSTDATPDMGISAAYLEVAIRKTQPESLFGEPGGVYVTCERDPVTNGIVSFTVETPVGQGATVNYDVDGTPQTPVVVAADDTQTVQVNATSFVEISRIELVPDEPA